MTSCPCGSGRAFADCCSPYLNGEPAPTAEALIRSRYTAFTLGDLDYVERTITDHAAASFNRVDMESALPGTEWLGLEIRDTEDGGEGDETGTVRFAFSFRANGRPFTQVERATFLRVDGEWRFHDSEINPKSEPVRVAHVGRNDPCPCGSGKKYKKCCGSAAASAG
jgi:SEC-C motif domain protein